MRLSVARMLRRRMPPLHLPETLAGSLGSGALDRVSATTRFFPGIHKGNGSEEYACRVVACGWSPHEIKVLRDSQRICHMPK